MKHKTIVLTYLLVLSFLSISHAQIEHKVYEVDGQITDLHWCGPDDSVVFAITDLNSLYRSENRGTSWTKLNDILTHTGKSELEETDTHVEF